ncbi:MAG: hypothetical protein FJ225_08975 [Lentisphaerae bacterium]|nr:hypothetical protein [Lentisphaerota bacterium]
MPRHVRSRAAGNEPAGPAPPGPEARGHRHAGRGRRPRDQQSHQRNHELCRFRGPHARGSGGEAVRWLRLLALFCPLPSASGSVSVSGSLPARLPLSAVVFGGIRYRFRYRTRPRDGFSSLDPGSSPSSFPSGQRRVRLTVEDRGCGIPDAVRERMFEPFYTTKPRDKGVDLLE